MLLATLLAALAPQGVDRDLAAVLDAESRRIEVMAAAEPAVCSVMKRGSPGGGSGVLFDPRGFVLTNFHVVGKIEVKRMLVGLPDGVLYEATVLGIDPGSDLAVLLIDEPEEGPREWPWAPLGNSDALLVGETVFAMGNPFLLATDFKPTVTWGIVSGTHRYQPGQGNRALVYPDCIQVDVPVNPGNSGGPLFNARGEIVGINGRISIRDRGRVNVGVGFAIASNQIRNFLGDLMAGRHAEHGTLDLNAWFMRSPDDKSRHGVFVQALFADSKVGEFGVQLGDEITTFNGIPVRSANQLATLVGVLPTGTWVSLGFRPQIEGGGYGPERTVQFTLPTLDTGSSNDPDRIAAEEHRALAATTIIERIPAVDDAAGADLSIHGPDGRTVRIRRSGPKLRIDDGDTVLVRTDLDGGGFRLDGDGTAAELSVEEATKLERVWATNPWLRTGRGLASILEGSVLLGGTMVHGRAAFRLRLPGDGQREVFLFEDGSAAGCAYRDPVQKKLVELRANGAKSRLLTDGTLHEDWSIGQPTFGALDPALFERPAR